MSLVLFLILFVELIFVFYVVQFQDQKESTHGFRGRISFFFSSQRLGQGRATDKIGYSRLF